MDVGEAGDQAQRAADLQAASSESFSQGMSSLGAGLDAVGDTQDAYSSAKRKNKRQTNRKLRKDSRYYKKGGIGTRNNTEQ